MYSIGQVSEVQVTGCETLQRRDLPSGKVFTTTGSSTQNEFTAIHDPIPNKATRTCVTAACFHHISLL